MTAPSYYTYWGKASDQANNYHLAAYHNLDVAAVADTLLGRHDVLRKRLASFLCVSGDAVVPTVAAFVALHDVGKFEARFQMKVPELAEALDPQRGGLPTVSYDHGAGGFEAVLDPQSERRALDPELVALLGEKSLPLVQAVCGHHGELPYREPPRDPRFRRTWAVDLDARQRFVRDVVGLFRTRGGTFPWLGSPSMVMVQLLAGLCAVADWIGSQIDFFPFDNEPRPLLERYDVSMQAAGEALDAIGFDGAVASGATFADLFPGYQPRDVQIITEGVELPAGPSLIIIEAQMGEGKTEAALALCAREIAKGQASGVYVALPTMATSNAMFSRLEDVSGRLFNGPLNMLLAHGRSRMNEALWAMVRRSLADSGSTGGEAESQVVCARWFLGRKRAMLGQLGVGTVDQAMQAVIRIKHNFVRAFGLARQVVVLDEVHAYDEYMEVILERLVEWLAALGAPVVLLSATLPSHRRDALVDAWCKGRGRTPRMLDELPGPDAPYPLVVVVSDDDVSTMSGEVSEEQRTIRHELLASPAPLIELVPRLLEAARAGARVVWIRNTVREAQDAFRAAQGHGVDTFLFHARFRECDRQHRENAVLLRFGREGPRGGGALLIATQVVEQSLDLDFDLMASDLAPVDLLLQRVGRLHRHVRWRPRPSGFEQPRFIIVEPDNSRLDDLDFGVSGLIYDPVTLWLSRETLAQRRQLVLPDDMRCLVEDVYHPGRRAARIKHSRIREALGTAERVLRAGLEGRANRARRVCVPPAGLEVASAGVFPDDDDDVRALTRDGESTTLVFVYWDGEHGASVDDGEPWRIAAEATDAWKTARALMVEAFSVPVFRERVERGVAPEGSSARWAAWEARFEQFARQAGLGSPIAVPVVEVEEGVFVGRVITNFRVRNVAYSKPLGMWYVEEGA